MVYNHWFMYTTFWRHIAIGEMLHWWFCFHGVITILKFGWYMLSRIHIWITRFMSDKLWAWIMINCQWSMMRFIMCSILLHRLIWSPENWIDINSFQANNFSYTEKHTSITLWSIHKYHNRLEKKVSTNSATMTG